MKTKAVFLITLLAFCLYQLNAQVSLGLKSSFVKAWEEYGDVGLPDDAEIHVNRFNFSALAYYKINDFVEVGIEPGFMQKGAACEPGFIIFEGDAKLFLNYAEAPLLLRINSPIIGNTITVFGKIGAGASRLLTAYREVEVFGDPNSVVRTQLDLNAENGMNKWDYGLHGALGFSVNIGNHELFAETNIYRGLTDVDPENRSENRTLQFGIGFLKTI